MKNYLIIIIIIVLYHIQKYCVQSEVDKFLITQNILEKFTDTTNNQIEHIKNLTKFANQLQNNGLDITNGIILRNELKINSNNNINIIDDANTYLKITDMSNNFKNMSIKNIDISGILTVRQTSRFFGSNNFKNTNINSVLTISSLPTINKIHSENGDLTLFSTGSTSDYINLNDNTCISGNLTIKGIKPILIKVVQINNNTDINTNVSYIEYPGITFGGYLNANASIIEFNAFKKIGSINWYISFTPNVASNSPFSIRLTFFHKNIVQEE
jgi:hypothetical protein